MGTPLLLQVSAKNSNSLKAGYSGFYSNFPDLLNPRLNKVAGVTTTVNLGDTYLEDNGFIVNEE